MNRHYELKTIINKVINEFEIEIEDPCNIYNLLKELKNSGLLTQAQFQKVEAAVVKNSIIPKDEGQPCLVLNGDFEIIFGNELFYELFGIGISDTDTCLFNEVELAKLKKAVTLVKNTNQMVNCRLKIKTLTKKVQVKILPNTEEGHYYLIFKI